MNGSDVVAIVPCHEAVPEDSFLAITLRHVARIILVDDGSSESVARRLVELSARPPIELVRLPRNVGKGSALRAGIDVALASARPQLAVLALDADGQHPADAIPCFLAAATDAELVIGDRLADWQRMPWQRRVTNRLSRRLLALSVGRPVGDTQCGMRLLHGRALHELRFPPGRYEAESKHLRACLKAGVTVAWVPIPAVYGSERSHFRAIRDGLPVLAALALSHNSSPAGTSAPLGKSMSPSPHTASHLRT